MSEEIERICPSCESIIIESEDTWASCLDCGLYLDMVMMTVACRDCGSVLAKIDSEGLATLRTSFCQSDKCK